MLKILIPALLVLGGSFAHAEAAQAPQDAKQTDQAKHDDGPDFFDLTVGQRMAECKGHFDIEPFFKIALEADDDEIKALAPETVELAKGFSSTGHFTLPPAQANDPVAQKCATFAEGMLVGGIGHQLVVALVKGVGDAVGKAIEGVVKGTDPKAEVAPKK